MDIHRIRFVPLPASEINALAFSHRSKAEESTPPQLRLALGRANGDIEIWNPMSRAAGVLIAKSNTKSIHTPSTVSGSGATWSQETILRGGKDRTVEGLAWTQDLDGETVDGKKTPGKLRLFSIGYTTHVTEWDLALGRPLTHAAAGQSDVWCIAAQPRWAGDEKKKKKDKKAGEAATLDPRSEQLLALGCGDGSIVLMSTADGLSYHKTLPRSSGKKSSVMSLAWLGRDRIVAGCSDSMIRVYEVKSPRGGLVSQMSLGNAGKGKPSETLVWTVEVLRNDTIVSGDSTGEIKTWDAKNFTLLQRIQSHLADVLSLASNSTGEILLSGGMDRRTTLYQRAESTSKNGRGRWAAVSHQRNHQSDVKTMATFESKQMSVVVSGGLDAMPVVNPLRTFGQENHRALPPFPSTPQISSASGERLLLAFWGREVSIWRIEPRTKTEDQEEASDGNGSTARKLVARIAVQGEDSITSADINVSGDLVAITTMSSLKLFHIRPRKALPTYRIAKVDLPEQMSTGKGAVAGAKLARFSPDGKWLAMALPDNSIRFHRLTRDSGAKQPWSVLDLAVDFNRHHGSTSQKAVWGTHEKYDHVVAKFAWSSDSRILVAGDLSGNMDAWVLEGTEDPDWTAAPTTNGKSKTKQALDDESSEDESDDEEHPEVILGQHWKPHSESLPRLPGAPVVLSFRPSSEASDPTEDANIGLHATRHNPAPHSHQLPHGEDRLLAVTAKQDVLEFSALNGKLTDWSKRNPPHAFPLAFRNVLDQAMDCVWDTKNGRSRVWLYGSTWLWMFDLSRDLPAHDEAASSTELVAVNDNNRKRKRELNDSEKRTLIKHNAGAGSKIHEHELEAGAGMRVRTHKGEQLSNEDTTETTFDAGALQQETENEDSEDEGEEEEVDSDDEDNKKLVALRRQADHADGQGHDREEGDDTGPPHHWHTFKYRPIVGIVPLEDVNGAGEQIEDGDIRQGKAMEVALVERPLWEADLKPRWEGPQEYGDR